MLLFSPNRDRAVAYLRGYLAGEPSFGDPEKPAASGGTMADAGPGQST
jgi:hypothetical protein